MNKRRIEITVETSFLVFRRTNRTDARLCAMCLSPARLIAPDEAAVLAGVSTRTIYRWVEAQKLHFAETSDSRLLICPNSLPLSNQRS
jgi:excisionase family DNA binding protein